MAIRYDPGEPLTCRQIRELDALAIEHVGIPGLVLMENAGRSVAEFICATLPDPSRVRVVVLCGAGNNGGDGFVAARHLAIAGAAATCVLTADRGRYRHDAARNLAILERLELPLIDAAAMAGSGPAAEAARRAVEECLARADVIVDALLGTGSSGAPRPPLAELIELANRSPARRVAVDVPTGLDADSGQVCEPCFRAHATVTLVAPKVGFDTPAARRVLGRVVVADIGLSPRLIRDRGNFPART